MFYRNMKIIASPNAMAMYITIPDNSDIHVVYARWVQAIYFIPK